MELEGKFGYIPPIYFTSNPLTTDYKNPIGPSFIFSSSSFSYLQLREQKDFMWTHPKTKKGKQYPRVLKIYLGMSFLFIKSIIDFFFMILHVFHKYFQSIGGPWLKISKYPTQKTIILGVVAYLTN